MTGVAVGPTDCLLEGELLKLGGPFLQMWQRKHAKLYPNRLEFYNKTRDGQVIKGKEGKGVEVSDRSVADEGPVRAPGL